MWWNKAAYLMAGGERGRKKAREREPEERARDKIYLLMACPK
jgi:hypothetical protein